MTCVKEKEIELKNKRVLIVGLGKSGRAASLFASERGAFAVATDIKTREELGDLPAELEKNGVRVVAGRHLLDDFIASDLIVVSPGVPMNREPFLSARNEGKKMIGEIEFASHFLKGRMIGITGSNGKSTTTALVAWILSTGGLKGIACGNIGTPLIEMVESDSADSFYAVELSSFQLETIETFRPFISILLNLSPDHLDRYDSYDSYVSAKGAIFRNQTDSDFAILNDDDRDSRIFEKIVKAGRLSFSSQRPVEHGAFVREGEIVLKLKEKEEMLIGLDEIPLHGMHNAENIMAASLAAKLCGVRTPLIRAAIMSFKGLPHRLEFIAEIRGISFYNDSKATNVDSTIKALSAFPGRKINLILGGRDKGGDFTKLIPLIKENVREVILTGEAKKKIRTQIEGSAPITEVASVQEAIIRGFKEGSTGDLVLLAPGCASFDAYLNYEERGDDFRNTVLELKEELGDA